MLKNVHADADGLPAFPYSASAPLRQWLPIRCRRIASAIRGTRRGTFRCVLRGSPTRDAEHATTHRVHPPSASQR
jgi:hypothetical protein